MMMKCLFALAVLAGPVCATTISAVPVFEPLSLHGTDVDEITETGEALQATVMSRPMALTGAFPEVLIDSIATSHRLPTNSDTYEVAEANLLVLCGVKIAGEMDENGLLVTFDVAELSIPEEVDLTVRQVLKLGLVAVRKTLEAYQRPQVEALNVRIRIMGTDEGTASLRDLDTGYTLPGG